ncbi:penicillin acylase family protein [Oceanomicrobium pacificus]|uniref:Penicillin acylase family protein n=1 Tax=Oceanomicrobium pacificus TaxID=2692916 RepID=A0A6B0TMP8_9RHOB|nr:penicillin acylase family protein [Oceanomicrobium pacificus]MXU65860.1 penicillin acylase family protein [Oceanomicrobium pacificus]
MERLFRWLLRSLIALVAIALLGAGLAYYLAAGSLPDYDRRFTVSGVSAPVEIVRDNHAVPHIFGETDADTLFGLGFVHAQDRLWQMTLLRRTAQGRLSEMFGERTLEIDHLMRALDIYGIARRAVAHQPPEAQALLSAYAAGVNAYLGAVGSEALGRGAPEFLLFSNEIAAWTPADSIAVSKLMALQLTDKAQKEVLRARLSLILPAERVRDLLPDAPNKPVMALPEFAALFDDAPAPVRMAAGIGRSDPLNPVRPVGSAGASNAWAAMGQRAAAGHPLLATDPHLGLTAPSIWMLARLQLTSGGVIGATIPGGPAILVGRNASLGWGLTAAYLDDQDLYIEELKPGDPSAYRVGDTYVPFRTRDVVITIKDAPPVTRTLRWTENGPVLPDEPYGLAAITPPDHVMSLAWTGLIEEDTTPSFYLELMHAKSVDRVRELAPLAVAPSTNLILADSRNVAIQTLGRMPRRNAAHSSQGRIPSPGWLDRNRWDGFFPTEDNPWVKNPPSGIVVNTNNKIVDGDFPRHFSFDWGDTQRITRAERLLNLREFHTLDSFIEIQTDDVSPTARNLLPLIGRDLWYAGQPAAEDKAGRMRQQALERLAVWNGQMTEHDPEPLIFSAWLRALQRRLVIDSLGRDTSLLTHPDPAFIERVFRDVDGASIWCDIQQTTAAESCQMMAEAALDDALLMLSERYGDRLESWRWGDAHEARHDHTVLGKIPVLSWFTNIRQDTSGGDNTLLRGRSAGTGPDPFANVHAAGFRGVFDFSDPEASVFIISTGQSGHFLSRHYDDLSVLWRRSEYVPMALDPVLARGGALGTTWLDPSN